VPDPSVPSATPEPPEPGPDVPLGEPPPKVPDASGLNEGVAGPDPTPGVGVDPDPAPPPPSIFPLVAVAVAPGLRVVGIWIGAAIGDICQCSTWPGRDVGARSSSYRLRRPHHFLPLLVVLHSRQSPDSLLPRASFSSAQAQAGAPSNPNPTRNPSQSAVGNCCHTLVRGTRAIPLNRGHVGNRVDRVLRVLDRSPEFQHQ